MSIIFRVNAWTVEEEDDRFIIRNADHPEWLNYYYKSENRYRYAFKRVPKQVDRVILQETGIFQADINRTFGIEIECFHPTDCSIREKVADKLSSIGIDCRNCGYTHEVMKKWKVVTDSSIRGGYGLEVVSPILKGQEGIDEVKQVMKVLTELGCRVNRSTGMHVHIGAKDLTSSQLDRCFDFYKKNESLFDSLVAGSRREFNNSYCKSLQNLSGFARDRYYKLNYCSYIKYGTLEFRQHQGSLNGDKAEHWIKLVKAVVDYGKSGRSVRQYSSLETMIRDLGLEDQAGWYLERAEELAS